MLSFSCRLCNSSLPLLLHMAAGRPVCTCMNMSKFTSCALSCLQRHQPLTAGCSQLLRSQMVSSYCKQTVELFWWQYYASFCWYNIQQNMLTIYSITRSYLTGPGTTMPVVHAALSAPLMKLIQSGYSSKRITLITCTDINDAMPCRAAEWVHAIRMTCCCYLSFQLLGQ